MVSGAIRTALTYSCTRTVFLPILDGHLMLHVDIIGVMEITRRREGYDATLELRAEYVANQTLTLHTHCSSGSSLIRIHPAFSRVIGLRRGQ